MNIATTTLFDLNQSASEAAIKAVGQDALSADKIRLDVFEISQFDPADYPQFTLFFNTHLNNYTAQKRTPSPAAAAAIAAAVQAKAAAAPTAVPTAPATPAAAPAPAPNNANKTAASVATNK